MVSVQSVILSQNQSLLLFVMIIITNWLCMIVINLKKREMIQQIQIKLSLLLETLLIIFLLTWSSMWVKSFSFLLLWESSCSSVLRKVNWIRTGATLLILQQLQLYAFSLWRWRIGNIWSQEWATDPFTSGKMKPVSRLYSATLALSPPSVKGRMSTPLFPGTEQEKSLCGVRSSQNRMWYWFPDQIVLLQWLCLYHAQSQSCFWVQNQVISSSLVSKTTTLRKGNILWVDILMESFMRWQYIESMIISSQVEKIND